MAGEEKALWIGGSSLFQVYHSAAELDLFAKGLRGTTDLTSFYLFMFMSRWEKDGEGTLYASVPVKWKVAFCFFSLNVN